MGYLDSSGLSRFWANIKRILSGKQDSLTVGDGLRLQGTKIDVTDPVKGITKAEYDALTDVEKNSGLYVLTDVEDQAIASGTTFTPSVSDEGVISWTNDGGLPNPEPVNIKGPQGDPGVDLSAIYSAEETRIGTWINGKPIYRRVVTGTTPATNGSCLALSIDQINSMNVENVIHIYGTVQGYDTGKAHYIPMNIYSSANDYAIMHMHFHLVIEIAGSSHCNKPFIIILEYTKTTDVATVSQVNLLTSEVELPETLSADSANEVSASLTKVSFPSVDTIASATYASASSVTVAFPSTASVASASASFARLNL